MILTLPILLSASWIVSGAGLLSFAGLWLLRWRDFSHLRRLRKEQVPYTAQPGISIVIPSCHAAQALSISLPELLCQQYPDFEIIVADESCDNETEDLLKVLEKDHLVLRHVSLPKGCAHQTRRRMAVTLGIRAARHEWIVLTEADCRPATPKWLSHMSGGMTDENEIVIGCATFFDREDESFPHAAILRLTTQLHWLKAASSGRPMFVDSANFAFRRSWFEQAGGYGPTLSFPLPYGENTILADSHGRKGHSGIVCCHEAMMLQDYPGKEISRIIRKEQEELVSQLSMKARFVRFRQRTATISAFLLSFSMLASAVANVIFWLYYPLVSITGIHGILTADILLFLILLLSLIQMYRNRRYLRGLLYGSE